MRGLERLLYKLFKCFPPTQSLAVICLLASAGMSLIFIFWMSFILVKTSGWEFIIWTVIFYIFMLSMKNMKLIEMGESLDYVIRKFEAVEINQFSHNPIIGRYIQIVSDLVVDRDIQRPQLFALPTFEINIFTIITKDGSCGIFITEGALVRLTKTELQTLVAREINAITHQDPALNYQLIGWFHGLQNVYLFGYMMFSALTFGCLGDLDRLHQFCLGYSLREVGDGGGSTERTRDFYGCFSMLIMLVLLPLAFVSLLVMLIGSVGAIAARVLKSALSKAYEAEADLTTSQFTKGYVLVDVLEKVALLETNDGDYSLSLLDESNQELSLCYFQNYSQKQRTLEKKSPIMRRILRIKPSYQLSFENKSVAFERNVMNEEEANDPILSGYLTSYFDRKKSNVGCNLILELNLSNAVKVFFLSAIRMLCGFYLGV